LTQAMRIYTPNFSLGNYQSYVYSSMEIRILMNIGIVQNRIDQQDKYSRYCLSA
jgi:heme exporter protein D